MTPEELLAQLSQPGPGEAYLATQGAGTGSGMFGFDPVSAVLSSALGYAFGIPSRNEAERAKNRAIEQATVNAMTAEGKNPYETYNVGMFDTSQYADLAGIPTIGTPEEMLRQTVSTVVDAYRKENPEKVEEEFEKIVNPPVGVSGTGGTSGVQAGADIFSAPSETTIPTPEETFKELEKEQQVARVQQVLANNPNATEEQIKTVIETYDIPAEVLTEATGQDSVKGYVEQRDLPPLNEQNRWLFEDGVMTNVDTGAVREVGDTTLYQEGGYYSAGDGELPTGETEVDKAESINIFLENNPNITLDVLRTKMKNRGVTDQDIIDATGKTPEQIAGNGDGTGGGKGNGGGGNGGGTEGGDGGNGGVVDQGTPTPTGTTTGTPTGTDTGNGDGDGNGNGEGNGNGAGMLFAALSPNRTTSEVLAPDLFKLDKNIPLVGRLTQNTPMAAPQYLLSGISQRYRV